MQVLSSQGKDELWERPSVVRREESRERLPVCTGDRQVNALGREDKRNGRGRDKGHE